MIIDSNADFILVYIPQFLIPSVRQLLGLLGPIFHAKYISSALSHPFGALMHTERVYYSWLW